MLFSRLPYQKVSDKENIRKIFEQSEWVKVEEKSSSPRVTTPESATMPISTGNQYAALTD